MFQDLSLFPIPFPPHNMMTWCPDESPPASPWFAPTYMVDTTCISALFGSSATAPAQVDAEQEMERKKKLEEERRREEVELEEERRRRAEQEEAHRIELRLDELQGEERLARNEVENKKKRKDYVRNHLVRIDNSIDQIEDDHQNGFMSASQKQDWCDTFSSNFAIVPMVEYSHRQCNSSADCNGSLF